MSNTLLRINSPSVAHETIEGEVVLINFETGCYYSSDALGAEIMGKLEHGASPNAIVENLVGRFDADAKEIEAAVGRFVGELREEKLVVEAAEGSVTGAKSPGSDAAGSDEKAAFAPPALHKYTDLEDLLLLDPIHDIERDGWPGREPK